MYGGVKERSGRLRGVGQIQRVGDIALSHLFGDGSEWRLGNEQRGSGKND